MRISDWSSRRVLFRSSIPSRQGSRGSPACPKGIIPKKRAGAPAGRWERRPSVPSGEGMREKALLVQKTGPMLAPGSKLGIDPRLFPQCREDLEFLRDAKPDDARAAGRAQDGSIGKEGV